MLLDFTNRENSRVCRYFALPFFLDAESLAISAAGCHAGK